MAAFEASQNMNMAPVVPLSDNKGPSKEEIANITQGLINTPEQSKIWQKKSMIEGSHGREVIVHPA